MKKGFTLLELVISIGIAAFVLLAVGSFVMDFFRLNRFTSGDLNREVAFEKISKNFVSEVRSAAQPSTGGYLIEDATISSVTFYAYVPRDGTINRIRYFVSGTTLQKGVVKPTGSPVSYNLASEATSTIMSDVTGSSIFSYYDASYGGTTTPLAFPVTVSDIRLIRMTIVSDPNGSGPPARATSTVLVTIRNLKEQ